MLGTFHLVMKETRCYSLLFLSLLPGSSSWLCFLTGRFWELMVTAQATAFRAAPAPPTTTTNYPLQPATSLPTNPCDYSRRHKAHSRICVCAMLHLNLPLPPSLEPPPAIMTGDVSPSLSAYTPFPWPSSLLERNLLHGSLGLVLPIYGSKPKRTNA